MTAKKNAWMVAAITCLFVAAIATTTTAQQRNGQELQSSADLVPLASLQESNFGDTAMSAMSRPAPAEIPCLWDCEPSPDGTVGINDFLTLLGDWGTIGTSCNHVNPGGVGISDFLALLAAWGPCP